MLKKYFEIAPLVDQKMFPMLFQVSRSFAKENIALSYPKIVNFYVIF